MDDNIAARSAADSAASAAESAESARQFCHDSGVNATSAETYKRLTKEYRDEVVEMVKDVEGVVREISEVVVDVERAEAAASNAEQTAADSKAYAKEAAKSAEAAADSETAAANSAAEAGEAAQSFAAELEKVVTTDGGKTIGGVIRIKNLKIAVDDDPSHDIFLVPNAGGEGLQIQFPEGATAFIRKKTGAVALTSEITALADTLSRELEKKQDTLEAGDNITLNGNTISATDQTTRCVKFGRTTLGNGDETDAIKLMNRSSSGSQRPIFVLGSQEYSGNLRTDRWCSKIYYDKIETREHLGSEAVIYNLLPSAGDDRVARMIDVKGKQDKLKAGENVTLTPQGDGTVKIDAEGRDIPIDTAMPGAPADDHVPSTQLLKEQLDGKLSLTGGTVDGILRMKSPKVSADDDTGHDIALVPNANGAGFQVQFPGGATAMIRAKTGVLATTAEVKSKQDALTAGDGITISGNVISSEPRTPDKLVMVNEADGMNIGLYGGTGGEVHLSGGYDDTKSSNGPCFMVERGGVSPYRITLGVHENGAYISGVTEVVDGDDTSVPNVAYVKALLDGSGGGYTLPTASSSVLGGIKVGSNLSITAGGVLTVKAATFAPLSHAHSADQIQTGTFASARLPVATASSVGAVKIGNGLSGTSDGSLSVSVGSGLTINGSGQVEAEVTKQYVDSLVGSIQAALSEL